MDEQAAAALKATWSLLLSSCCVLWIDTWYRAQYTQTKVTGRKTVLQWQYFN